MLPVVDCIARGIDDSLPNLWWIWGWLRHLPFPTLRDLQSHGWTRSARDLPMLFFWSDAKREVPSSNTQNRSSTWSMFLYLHTYESYQYKIYRYDIMYPYRTQIFCSLHSRHCFTASIHKKQKLPFPTTPVLWHHGSIESVGSRLHGFQATQASWCHGSGGWTGHRCRHRRQLGNLGVLRRLGPVGRGPVASIGRVLPLGRGIGDVGVLTNGQWWYAKWKAPLW